MIDDCTIARFERRETPYIKRRWGQTEVKRVVHIEISAPHESTRADDKMVVQVNRPMTDDDKLRWPEEWAQFVREHG